MSNWKIIVSGSTKDLTDDYGYYVTQQFGVGMPSVRNVSQESSLADGGVFQRTKAEPRQFTLTGVLSGSSVSDLHTRRRNLIDDLEAGSPIEIQYHGSACTLQASAYYDGGLELGDVVVSTEKQMALRFLQYDPAWEVLNDTETSLSHRKTFSFPGRFFMWSASTGWVKMGNAAESGPLFQNARMAISRDGDVYAATLTAVIQWDGSSWSKAGSTATGLFERLAFDPSDNLYATGTFDGVNGVSACRIAKYNGTSWSAVGDTFNNDIRGIAVGPDGAVYVGGEFTASGSVAASRVAKWDGGPEWEAIAGGLSSSHSDPGIINDLTYSKKLYAGGTLNEVDLTTNACYIFEYDTTWSQMGQGIAGDITDSGALSAAYQVESALSGQVIIGGNFTSADGNSARGCAKWTGINWENAGSPTGVVNDLAIDQTGKVHGIIGGEYYQFNGSDWVFNGIKVDSGDDMNGVDLSGDDVIIGGVTDALDTVTAGVVTTITPSGTAKVYPTISASGPGQFYYVKNNTTGDQIHFDNLVLGTGEVVTIDLSPGSKTVESSFQGNLVNKIIAGGNLSTWHLTPGTNYVELFINDASASAELTYKDRYWGTDV